MEVDQLAAFHVNNRVISDVYKQTREQGDSVSVPEYWCELSAYNVLNFASMYSSAQLLIDPERNPDDMLCEAVGMIFGEKYYNELLSAHELVRDARSGDKWSTYWWLDDGFDLGTSDPESIEKRAEKCLCDLEKISCDRTFGGEVKAALEPYEIVELMLPHVEQIRLYARFRIEMKELYKKLEEGAAKEKLAGELDRIWQPIPDFNTIIGVFGQLEANYQDRAVYTFCEKAGIVPPKKGYRDQLIIRRFTDSMIYRQRTTGERLEFAPDFYSGPFVYINDAVRILDKMTDEKILEKNENGTYSLKEWRNFRYDCN